MNLPSTRGLRNKNPFNLKEGPSDKTKWVGERATNDDPTFEEFEKHEDGLRAGFITILNYNKLYGLSTVESILERFAPATENNLDAYIGHVCMQVGANRNVTLDFKNPHVVLKMGKGIIRHENGCQPYGDDLLWPALRKAYQQTFNMDIGALA